MGGVCARSVPERGTFSQAEGQGTFSPAEGREIAIFSPVEKRRNRLIEHALLVKYDAWSPRGLNEAVHDFLSPACGAKLLGQKEAAEPW